MNCPPPQPGRLPPEAAWQLVRLIQEGNETRSRQAWNDLYEAYWEPLVIHLLRCGYSRPDAEDLAQNLFIHLLASGALNAFRQEAGTVAAFLHGVLRRIVSDDTRKRRAAKRGGGLRTLSLEEFNSEAPAWHEPLDHNHPQAELLKREMADLAEQARRQLRARFAAKQKARTFDLLRPYLCWDEEPPPHHEIAEQLGSSECAVRVMISRLRGQFRRRLEGAIAL